jgi:hypothetical protein
MIDWIDAHQLVYSWTPANEVPMHACVVRSVGFFLSADQAQVVYAQDWVAPSEVEPELYVHGVSGIPLGCITGLTVWKDDRG